MSHPYHLVFIGDVGAPATYHVGDEAMLEANLDAFRACYPDLIATIVSRDPAWSSSHYRARAIAPIGFPSRAAASDGDRLALLDRLIRNLEVNESQDCWGRQAIAAVAESDGVVVSGGGNLSATWPEHVFERVALGEIAHRLGKPIILIGQTIGPNLSPTLEPMVAQMLQRAKVVGVRELSSAALALALGVPSERLIYQTDDALDLAPVPIEDTWAKSLHRDQGPWIALTLDPFAEGDEAALALTSLASQLAQFAMSVQARLVFIPHVAAVNAESAGDVAVGRELAARLPQATPMFVCDVQDARQTRWLTGRADLIVSTRYHPLVFGMAAAVPGLGLFTDEYRRVKLQGALAHANLAHCCISLQQAVEEGRLFEMARSLWDRREELRGHLLAMHGMWRDQAALRWRKVFAALGLPMAKDPHRREAILNAEGSLDCVAHPLIRRLLDELEARRRSMVGERTWALRRSTQAEQYIQSLETECTRLHAANKESERYAQSLLAERVTLEAMRAESERYALSLEAERHK